jgi:aminoglycoside 3-N-acetyltransferase
MLRKTDIMHDLQRLGVYTGDILLVHSSLSSLGHVDGGADTVIDALLETLGPDGTLLMPSFQGGREYNLLKQGCTFDVRTSPCELGIIPEIFRQRPGVFRSINPTHCTAGIGKHAEKILDGHQFCNVSVGRNSPYDRLQQTNGKILLLGVTHKSNTTLHFVENTGGAPSLSRELFDAVAIDADGKSWTVPMHPHLMGLKKNYERAENELLAADIQHNGNVGAATARLIDAAGMTRHLQQRLRENPCYLIEVFTP